MKLKPLYKLSLFCGLTPMIIGSLIFIIWWIARAWFVIDLSELEIYGFLWVLTSIGIASLGLFAITVVLLCNPYSKKIVYTIFIILGNIPVLIGILYLQTNIHRRVYFKISNYSEHNDLSITIKSNIDSSTIFSHVNDDVSVIGSYRLRDERFYGDIDLTIKYKNGVSYLYSVPSNPMGSCVKFELDKNFILHENIEGITSLHHPVPNKIEAAENQILHYLFDEIIGADTSWKQILIHPEAILYGLHIVVNDSLIHYDDSLLNIGEQALGFDRNFYGINSAYKNIVLQMANYSRETRKLSTTIIKTKYDYIIHYGNSVSETYQNYVMAEITFSRISFNSDLTKACLFVTVYCGNFCGHRSLYFIEKKDKQWIISGQKLLSVS